jgi:hypothetical protein
MKLCGTQQTAPEAYRQLLSELCSPILFLQDYLFCDDVEDCSSYEDKETSDEPSNDYTDKVKDNSGLKQDAQSIFFISTEWRL